MLNGFPIFDFFELHPRQSVAFGGLKSNGLLPQCFAEELRMDAVTNDHSHNCHFASDPTCNGLNGA